MSKKSQSRPARELEEPRWRTAADTLLWFVAGLAVLLAVGAGVLFVLDLIWGTE